MPPAVETQSPEVQSPDTDLTEMLVAARKAQNDARFDDAETAFLKLYNEIQVELG